MIHHTEPPAIPTLPGTVPWIPRVLCGGAKKLPRGYGRAISHLARLFKSLQTVQLPLEACGDLWIDLRENICIPLYINGCYNHQLPEDRIIRTLLREGMTVFDIGANLGFYTRLISELISASGRIVAVEPMPRALRLLRLNRQLCAAQVTVIPAAIGGCPGTAGLRELERLDTSFVEFDKTSASGSRVEVITIDHLTDSFGCPDFLKIDIEGAELHALQGATRTLSNPTPPPVMIEYIESNARQFGAYTLDDICDVFYRHDYVVYRIGWPCTLFELGTDAQGLTNDYLAVPDSQRTLVEHLVHPQGCSRSENKA